MLGSEHEDHRKESAQAGRTMDPSLTPAPKITVFNLHPMPTPDNDNVHSNEHDHSANQASVDSTFSQPETQLSQPLQINQKHSPHLAQVSLLRSEFLQRMNQSPQAIDDTGSSLVQMILADFENNQTPMPEEPKTPTNENMEENYMTMTPKKSLLDLSFDTKTPEVEENHYVEMTTQEITKSLLAPNESETNIENQPYEMVYFGEDGNTEPVYMELAQMQKDVLACSKSFQQELPDILMASQNPQGVKSDGSDADDEASKDLDSFSTPSHPRFSLSDTFRPASYYLSNSQNAPEFQDSSDSELMSPPPIPRSPPTIDDLNNTEPRTQDFSFEEQDKDENKFATKDDSYLDRASITSSTKLEGDTAKRLSESSDLYVELRATPGRKNEYLQTLKRKAVSEEFCDELMSLDSSFQEGNFSYFDDGSASVISDRTNISNSTVKVLSVSEEKGDATEQFPDYENLCIVDLHKNLDTINFANISNTNIHNRDSSKDTTSFANSESSELRAMVSPTEGLRIRPESSASTSIEIAGLLYPSSRSTPRADSSLSTQDANSLSTQDTSGARDRYLYYNNKNSSASFDSNTIQYRPYYYSDLNMNVDNNQSNLLTLNNQRSMNVNENKKDISHIINPIRCSEELQSMHQNLMNNTFKLAAEARSVSVDFLNLTDKSGQIDKKNIYESDTLKRIKVNAVKPEWRNLCARDNTDKFTSLGQSNLNDTGVRRSHSLEELLENVLLNETTNNANQNTNEQENVTDDTNRNDITEGSYLWEEDAIWRDRLRTVSQRHTKSMDNLDFIGDGTPVKQSCKKQARSITRGVTYVNDNMYNMPLFDKPEEKLENQRQSKVCNSAKDSFIIDREKLRQWDLMSSAPSNAQVNKQTTQVMALGSVAVSEGLINLPENETNTTQLPGNELGLLIFIKVDLLSLL